MQQRCAILGIVAQGANHNVSADYILCRQRVCHAALIAVGWQRTVGMLPAATYHMLLLISGSECCLKAATYLNTTVPARMHSYQHE